MASTPDQLIEQTSRHAAFLEGHKTSAVKEYEALLQRMRTEAVSRLSSGRDLTEFSRARLERRLAALDGALRDITGDITTLMRRQMRDLSSFESGFEARSLGNVVPREFVVPSDTQLFSAVFSQPMQVEGPFQGQLLDSFFDGFSDRAVRRIDGAVRVAFAQGQTTAQLVSNLIGSGGVMDLTRRDVQAVVRTAMTHASVVARERTWQANDDIIKGVRIVAVLDNRTSAIDRSLDGKVFPVDKGPRPPFHAQCRATTAAVLDDRFSRLEEGGTRRTRDPETGEVKSTSAGTTYYQWLKRQPRATQDAIIGPTRGKLLRNGGIGTDRFAELQLGKNFRPLTLDEMRALEPVAFERAKL